MPVKTMVVEGPDSAVECRDCQKAFASKKNLTKHQSRCKARRKNPPGIVAKEKDKAASPEIQKNSFLAYECNVCCRLFKSAESLENHTADHSDSEEEEIVENLDLADPDSDAENDIATSLSLVDEMTQQVLPREVFVTLTKKAGLMEQIKDRETFLASKLAKIKARGLKEIEDKMVSYSVAHITKLRNDVLNIKNISQKKEELEVRLSKLKNLIEKKEITKLEQGPQEKKSLKVGSAKRKFESKFSKSNKKSKKEEIKETAGSADKESKNLRKIISMSVYKEITEKISGLSKLELEFSRLKTKLEKVNHLVSKKVQEGEESSEEIKTEPLTPEKIELGVSHEPETSEATEEDVAEDNSGDVMKPEKKIQALKSKLERQLVRRNRINSKLEAMLGQGEEGEEAAARRLEARLAREATVREVKRRQEERRQAERDRELEQQQHNLSSEVEELRSEIQSITEQNTSPENSASKKKSRKELRKHLQGKVEPRPSLAMSLETRLKNILDLEEEKQSLAQKLEELKTPKEAIVKVENSAPDESDSDYDIKPEVKALELEVFMSDSDEDSGDDLLLEHFVTDKKTFREMMLKKSEEQHRNNQRDYHDDKKADVDVIKQEVDCVDDEETFEEDCDYVFHKVEKVKSEVSEESEVVQDILDQLMVSVFINSCSEDNVEQEEEEEEAGDTFEANSEGSGFSEGLAEDILETILMEVGSLTKEEDICIEEVKDELEDLEDDVADEIVVDPVMELAEDMEEQEELESENEAEIEAETEAESKEEIEEEIEEEEVDQKEAEKEDQEEDPEEADTEVESDILDGTWSECDKFLQVVGQDESAEEAEILRIFQSGSLTRTRLAESLPDLGWVSCEDSAEFLPAAWFMRLDTNTYMETGQTTFFFITDNFHICLSATSAVAYLREHHYSASQIEQFEQHFGI